MPQPANKRFVMEDKLTTELALKAPIASPTFTGTVNATTVTASGTVSAATVTASAYGAISASSVTTSGDVIVNGELTSRGYRLAERFIYKSSPANFTKATYPWLRAIRVVCVGGGGGGGGAATTGASQNAIGCCGSGAATAETFITDIAGLGASIAIVVGAGGAGGAAGNNSGVDGGDSSFGSLCVAAGGAAGTGSAATGIGTYGGGINAKTAASSTGDIIYLGTGSGIRQYLYAGFVTRPYFGGSSVSPGHRAGQVVTSAGFGGTAPDADSYGVGGGGGINAQNQGTARTGSAGSDGLVIVELYA